MNKPRNKKTFITASIFVVFSLLVLNYKAFPSSSVVSGVPPYGLSEDEFPDSGRFSWLSNWKRPDEPTRVGIQIGHLENDELPEELEKHKDNTGSSGGGHTEVEVNSMIAEATAEVLREKGIEVDLLPATIPPSYWADVFLSIHTDGNLDSSVRGFKVASPWRDFTSDADNLVKLIGDSYQSTTGLPHDDNITKNMRGYYAFAWWKYEHTIHPMTTAAIIETGFLTNFSDRMLLVGKPEIPAKGLAEGIIRYLESENLLPSSTSSRAPVPQSALGG